MKETSAKQIEYYFDENGKIISYPTKRNRQLRPFLYEYLIKKFDKNKVYNEIEVNNIIKNWITFDDYIIFRRELVDFGYLSRSNDCREYKVTCKES